MLLSGSIFFCQLIIVTNCALVEPVLLWWWQRVVDAVKVLLSICQQRCQSANEGVGRGLLKVIYFCI